MRYLGNKTSIVHIIEEFLEENLPQKDQKYSFFDAFSGTGTVSDYLSKDYEVIANDYYYYSYAYTQGRLNNDVSFDKLGFDPFVYFNKELYTPIFDGFIYNNYAPKKSSRMYFSDENAVIIDSIRVSIDRWLKEALITLEEYYFLLASLLYSVSKVANVAGVYGSFLKSWDPRAKKKMQFLPVKSFNKKTNITVYNSDVNQLVENIDADILYLDPPYTNNQYCTQYHLLETIAKYDNPQIKGVTGTRIDKKPSNWSRTNYAQTEFEEVIRKTKSKYILMSYSSSGIMHKDLIASIFKRYSVPGSVRFLKLEYKKYRNSRTNSTNKHYEYLFFAKKSQEKVFFTSPLNYMGSKEKLVPKIYQELPDDIDVFYDLFGGGFNVGVNIDANKVVYNDLNFIVTDILKEFKKEETVRLLQKIKRYIRQYSLENENKENYHRARKSYNDLPFEDRDPLFLYSIILYGFQQQIRFNSKYDFNNPVGQSGYNYQVEEKIITFSERLKSIDVEFVSKDFEELENSIGLSDFIYCDPPYLVTLGSYNDGKRGFNGWNDSDEKRLLKYLDNMNSKGIRFMLSNVIEHRGRENIILKEWLRERDYNIIDCGKVSGRNEILVTNYKKTERYQ